MKIQASPNCKKPKYPAIIKTTATVAAAAAVLATSSCQQQQGGVLPVEAQWTGGVK